MQILIYVVYRGGRWIQLLLYLERQKFPRCTHEGWDIHGEFSWELEEHCVCPFFPFKQAEH